MGRGKYKRKRERKKNQAVSISTLGFSTKLENILVRAGLHTLTDLTSLSESQLKAVPGIGDASCAAVCEKLKEHGAMLREDDPHNTPIE